MSDIPLGVWLTLAGLALVLVLIRGIRAWSTQRAQLAMQGAAPPWPDARQPVTRAAVRALAEHFAAALQTHARAGGNAMQLSLDQADRIQHYALKLTDDNRSLFMAMYSEEMGAITASMNMNAATASASSANLGAAITVFLLFALFVIFSVM